MSCEHLPNRDGVVTFQGAPLTLVGPELKVGDAAPDFTVVKQDMTPASFGDLAGATTLISVVPSLDTSVCDLQSQRFLKEADALGDVKIITISMDLPFAQARWCGAHSAEAMDVVSDYQSGSFGKAYGVMIRGLRLLTRSIFVIKDGKIAYIEIVPEMTDHPDYDKALAAAKG